MGGRREEKLNQKLCEFLIEDGLDAVHQSERPRGQQIDIEVFLNNNVRIAIECEKYQTGVDKRTQATGEASGRLHPIMMVHVALVVVYPRGCDTDDDLTRDTVLSYAIVTPEAANRYGNKYKELARSLPWSSCRVSELHLVVRGASRTLGNPDAMAADLKKKLDDALVNLSDQQRKRLGKAINLSYDGEKNDKKRIRCENFAAKRALLVVASSALFHARLDENMDDLERPPDAERWPPDTLQTCYMSPNVKMSLLDAWDA